MKTRDLLNGHRLPRGLLSQLGGMNEGRLHHTFLHVSPLRPLRNTLNRLQGNVESILTWLPHICFIARTINARIRVRCVFENAARPDLSLRFFWGATPFFTDKQNTLK